MLTKLKSERLHCKKRAFERFGLSLNHKDLAIMAKMIQDLKGEFLRRRSCRVTLWKLNYKDTEMVCVYDKNRKNIITVFKPGR